MSDGSNLIPAVQRATRTLAQAGDIDRLLRDVLDICVEAVGASGGTIYLHEPSTNRLRFHHVVPEWVKEKLPQLDIPDDYGAAGEAFQSRSVVLQELASTPSTFEDSTGIRIHSLMSVPLHMENEVPIGVVQLVNKTVGAFTQDDAMVMDTVAAVCTMAVLNSRLTEESTRASSLLGMGKVSHDIGNLAASLYSTIGYAEYVLSGLHEAHQIQDIDLADIQAQSLDGLFGEMKASVDRVVGYSRLISDLSAGKELRPHMVVSSLAETIKSAAAYLETEARRNAVELQYEIDESAPETAHDSLYVFRIVQNLIGNAIKAVRETLPDVVEAPDPLNPVYQGAVTCRYSWSGGEHRLEILDTGAGMTPAVAERILSGNARSQWDKGGGSGWGTKIVLDLTRAHEGRVEIDSTLGQGSTFRVVLPHRPAVD